MTGTSIRISDETYKMIVKTKGIFEQMFKENLSLDDTAYLSSRLISFIYEEVQKLQVQKKIAITENPDGKLKVQGLESMGDVIRDIIPEVINEFTEINVKLSEKRSGTRMEPLTEVEE